MSTFGIPNELANTKIFIEIPIRHKKREEKRNEHLSAQFALIPTNWFFVVSTWNEEEKKVLRHF